MATRRCTPRSAVEDGLGSVHEGHRVDPESADQDARGASSDALRRPISALRETIPGQADALARVLSVAIDEAVATIEPAKRVWFVGTGTSQHAAELRRRAAPRPRPPTWWPRTAKRRRSEERLAG